MFRIATKRRVVVGIAVTLLLFLCGYLTTFFVIRATAYRDYEHLRTTGDWPAWSDIRKYGGMIPYDDGGSIGRPRFGFELVKINRLDANPQPPSPDALRVHERGAALVFTCRGWFPILQRLMVDREEITMSDTDD